MNKHHWTVWLFCSFIHTFAYSQNIDIQSFSLENGLSQSSIHAFHEDRFGILWLSTGDGLNAFDGKSINKYFLSPMQNLNPAGNSFRNIISDSLGNLFVGSDKGLYYFNRAKLELISCFADTDKMMSFASLPLFFNQDTLYALVQSKGLLRLNPKTGKYKVDNLPSSISHLEIFMDYPEEKWSGRFPDLLIRHRLKNNQIQESTISLNLSHLGLYITLIKLNPEQTLLIYGDKVFLIDNQTDDGILKDQSAIYHLEEHEDIKTGCQLENGEIWLVTENDSVLSYKNGIFQRKFAFRQPGDGNRMLSNITHLFKDSEHRIWVGTDGCGFALVKKAKPAFKPLNSIQTTDSLIINPFIRSFTEDNSGNLWIGTYKSGLIKFNPKDRKYSSYKFGHKTEFPSFNDIYSLSSVDQLLLIGTSKGVLLFNTQTQDLQRPVNQDTAISIMRVSGILPYAPGKFIIHANKKIQWLIKNKEEWFYEPGPFPDSLTIDQLNIKQDSLFGFTYHGIYVISGDKMELRPYTFQGKKLQIKVNAAVPDSGNTYWIASNAGLFQLLSDGTILKNYSIQDGLPSHYLYGIIIDPHRNLWISSNGGLSYFNPQNGRFRNFTTEDGLQSMEFNTGAYYTSQSGKLYFGGIGGYNCISGEYASEEEKYPRLYLKNLFIQDAPANLDIPVISLKTLDLPYYKNTLSFEFEAVDFCQNKAHPFEYQLENHDQNWIFAGDNKLIRYSHLEPGEYELKIRYVGEDDPSKSIIIRLNIRKPYWQEFYIVVPAIILILISFYLLVRFLSTRKMKKQIARLEQERMINQVRSRIASDLHDEIGTGLSKLAMLTDSMKLNTKLAPEFNIKLNDLSTKARLMTDQLRTIVWTLDPSDDSMEGLIAYIRVKLSEFMEDREITFSYRIAEEIPVVTVSAEFRRNLYYAVLESVHNVIKHAQAKTLQVIIEFTEDQILQLIIEDDGIGFDPECIHPYGHGLTGIKKRMQELGGDLQVQSAVSQGTKIRMSIPF